MGSVESQGCSPDDQGGRHDQILAGDVLLLDVVREVVEELAPAELPVVVGLGRLDNDEITRRLQRRAGRRDPLGFGHGDVVVLTTAIVWIAVQETVKKMADSATDGIVAKLSAVARRLLHRPTPARALPRFDEDALAEVHRRVMESAKEHGFKEPRALQLADCVVRKLAIGTRPVGGASGSLGAQGGPRE